MGLRCLCVSMAWLAFVQFAEMKDCTLDVVFVVDQASYIEASSPVNNSNQNWNLMTSFLTNLFDLVTHEITNTQLATVTFGDNSTVVFYLNTYPTSGNAANSLANLDYMGGGASNVASAFRMTRTSVLTAANGRRSGVPGVCLLLVAYPPVAEADDTDTERDLLRQICRLIVLVTAEPDMLLNLTSVYSNYANPVDFFSANFTSLNSSDIAVVITNSIARSCPVNTMTTTEATTTTSATTTGTTAPTTTAEMTTPIDDALTTEQMESTTPPTTPRTTDMTTIVHEQITTTSTVPRTTDQTEITTTTTVPRTTDQTEITITTTVPRTTKQAEIVTTTTVPKTTDQTKFVTTTAVPVTTGQTKVLTITEVPKTTGKTKILTSTAVPRTEEQTKITISTVIPRISPSNIFIQPTYGPEAGGTEMTIQIANWKEENASISSVYIGTFLLETISNRTGQSFSTRTSPLNDTSLINQPLAIALEISPGSVKVNTGLYFTYKQNPLISDVIPRELPISGGISMTIIGVSLDSVFGPYVRATVSISSENNTYQNQSNGPCYPPTNNGTQMTCLSPVIYIPEDFLFFLYDQSDTFSNSSTRKKRHLDWNLAWKTRGGNLPLRSKRSTSIFTNQTYFKPNSNDRMEIYLGVIFDGYKRYEDNLLLDSIGGFDLFYPPSLQCETSVLFDSNNDEVITIQGTNMAGCCRKGDYAVRIGSELCSITELTDNALTCSPPKIKPQQTEDDTLFCGEDFAIFVDLGKKTYRCSCLSYSEDRTKFLIIVIATTVGSSFVLFVVVIIISIVVKRRRRRKESLVQEFSENPLTRASIAIHDSQMANYSRKQGPVECYNNAVAFRNRIYEDDEESYDRRHLSRNEYLDAIDEYPSENGEYIDPRW